MKNSSLNNAQLNPLVIFWLGLLTGALIVGLTFLYQSISLGQIETSVLNARPTLQTAPFIKVNKTPSIPSLNKMVLPSKTNAINLKQFPTPPGG